MATPSSGIERVAHRGSPRLRRENTLPGFLLALEHGADALELDVHLTADGVPVVHHDPDVGGVPIAASDWGSLADIDLGGGARIPRLLDVLDAINGRAMVYVEIKGAAIEETVVTVVRAHGAPAALHSFDHDAIARAAALAPEIPRGVLLDRGTANPAGVMAAAVARTTARDVWPHWSLVDSTLMAMATTLEVRVIPWTVNTVDVARRMAERGVDGICTDDVRMLANL